MTHTALKDPQKMKIASRKGGPRPNSGPKKGSIFAKTRRKRAALASLLAQMELADDRWAQEVLTIALLDVRVLFDDQGNVLPVKDWPPELGAVVPSES
jgi:hypothetical protein